MFAAVAKATLDPLDRERAEIEKRRARFEERRQRILNAKQRTIGIDTSVLDKQIHEKQQITKLEQEREKFYAQQTLEHSKTIGLNQEQRRSELSQERSQLAFYRQQQAALKQNRDSAEQALYKQYNSPNQSRSAVFLNFAGEDPDYLNRQRQQQAQQQQWNAQQLFLEEEKQAKERAAAAEYAKFQSLILSQLDDNHKQQYNQQKDRLRQTTNYNQSLHQNKLEREKQEKAKDQYENELELHRTLRSSFLNEDTTSYSNANVHFKGFSTNDKQRILDEQSRQIELKRLEKLRGIEEEKQYADQQEQYRRELVRVDRAKANEALGARLALREQHLQQHQVKEVRENYLNSVVYQNPVGKEYFDQFGTSHR
jgi:hypothetical protein